MKALLKRTFYLRRAAHGSFRRLAAFRARAVFGSCSRRAKLFVTLLAAVLLHATAHAQRPLVQLDLQQSNGIADATYIYFEAGATEAYDSNFDAQKLTNPSGLNLASFAQTGEKLAIYGLPTSLLTASYTVNLFVGVPLYNTYTLQVSQLTNFYSTDIFLTDALLNTSTLLTPGTSYPFDMTAANTNGTYTSTRFALVFQPNGNPLPVTLTSFTAQAQPPGVALAWHTANEKHSTYFAIERSADGQSFTEIGRVAAAGTTNQAHSYAFYDPLPLGGTSYYRLRQVDVDASFQYSPVRVVSGQLASEQGSVFPNPARAGTLLRGAAPGVPVQVFDALGRVVAAALADASGTFVLPVGLRSGLYLVRSGQESTRLVVE